MRRLIITVLLALPIGAVLPACTPRGEIAVVAETPPDAVVHPVFVATSRSPVKGAQHFGAGRADALSYARYDISVPPSHVPGAIEWPHNFLPDPARHFVTTEQVRIAPRGLTRSIDRQLAQTSRDEREVTLFVHGFNSNFPEGLYRLAQITHDFDLPGVAVTYSWPSAGNPLGYIYDRDSTVTARDGLESVIRQIMATRAERIVIVAHSMGAFLTMEALRQNAIAGRSRGWSKLAGIVLLSPDIDVDVFRAQAERIGQLPQPFIIFTSQRDHALRLSAQLTGQPARLGSVETAEKLSALEVTVIDTTNLEGGDGLHHSTVVTSPAAISILRNLRRYDAALDADQLRRQGLLPGTVTLFRNATQVVLTPLGL